MRSDSASVEAYLRELPDDRRTALEGVRQVILDHLPEGFEEVMRYGMISHVVPLRRGGPGVAAEARSGRRR